MHGPPLYVASQAQAQAPQTAEQRFAADNWPAYLHGVSLGGLFVIEDITASSCRNYVASDPIHSTKCTKFSCHKVNAGMAGGTSGCITLTNGGPTFLATLELAELTDGTGQVAC